MSGLDPARSVPWRAAPSDPGDVKPATTLLPPGGLSGPLACLRRCEDGGAGVKGPADSAEGGPVMVWAWVWRA